MRVYLELLHGRKSASGRRGDADIKGPVFGPLDSVDTNNSFHIKLSKGDLMHDLFVERDLLYYGGLWYAEWRVFPAKRLTPELEARLQPYDQSKARRSRTLKLKSDTGTQPSAPSATETGSNTPASNPPASV